MTRPLMLLVGLAICAAAPACTGERTPMRPYVVHIGDAAKGERVIRDVGCGSCHTIPGIRGADGLVGPPLMSWSRRTYIAGEIPNTPDNLVRWLRNPRAIEPKTAMPALGLNDQQARAVAAYLYTLR